MLLVGTRARPQDIERQPAILGISLTASDFSKPYGTINSFEPGVGLSFVQGFTRKIDWGIVVGGKFSSTALKNSNISDNKLLSYGSFLARARLSKSSSFFQPYLGSAVGLEFYKPHSAFYLEPFGGIQIRYRSAFLNIGIHYQVASGNDINNCFFYSFTLSGLINPKKFNHKKSSAIQRSSTEPIISKDSDGDGIPDEKDACPNLAGDIALKGCPPISVYEIVDTDKDGLPDKEDQCPLVPGLKINRGCPDSDGDGLIDLKDSCIYKKGPLGNNGCPIPLPVIIQILDLAAKQIHFKTGSYILESKSFPALNEVVALMKRYPSFSLFIYGHTDNSGNPDSNLILSEKRALSVKHYLLKEGIKEERLIIRGYGQGKPIDTNETADGKSKNRRVELQLKE